MQHKLLCENGGNKHGTVQKRYNVITYLYFIEPIAWWQESDFSVLEKTLLVKWDLLRNGGVTPTGGGFNNLSLGGEQKYDVSLVTVWVSN